MNGKRVVGVLIAGLMVWSIGSARAETETGAAGVEATSVAASNPEAAQANIQGLAQRAAVVNQLADKFEAEAAAQLGTGFNALDWRRDFGARLMSQPAASLSAALSAPDLSTAQAVLYSAGKPGAKHTTNGGWVINMLSNPCRIVDTRFGGGGILGPLYRLWSMWDSAAVIAAQGGNPAGCGTFSGADGALFYVTVVPINAGGPDFLAVQHDNFPTPPSSATMNFYSQNIANFALVPCQGACTASGAFYAYASRNTHVVIDLIGTVGSVDHTTALECVKTFVENTAIAANATFNIPIPACPAGYTLTGAGCRTPGFNQADWAINGIYSSSLLGAIDTYCSGQNHTAGVITVQGTAQCCRVPSIPIP